MQQKLSSLEEDYGSSANYHLGHGENAKNAILGNRLLLLQVSIPKIVFI
jgi:hypothetical protein